MTDTATPPASPDARPDAPPEPGGRFIGAFATPIGLYPWPDSEALNAALADQILARERADAGQRRSNVGGWHSESDLMRWPGEPVAVLNRRILRLAAEATSQTLRAAREARFNFGVTAWANVSRDGHYNTVHAHAGVHWAGVYYVATGEPEGDDPRNGRIEFVDPRTGGFLRPPEGTFEESRVVTPEPGLMLIFPGWLKHFVHPFRGRGARISIAFNIVLAAPSDAAGAEAGGGGDSGAGGG